MPTITELMKELNYPTNEEGVCLGVAFMAERARRSGQYQQFKERIKYLEQLSTKQLESLIADAKQHSALLRENPSMAPLTKNEEILLTVEAFFFQVWMHFSPSALQNFLQLDDANLAQAEPHAQRFLQVDAPKLSQGDAHIAETFMYENDSQDKEISPLKAPKQFFISDTKQPEKLVFLQEFLEKIQSNSQKDDLSLGTIISSGNHSIHVFYDHKANVWTVTNNSDLSNRNSVGEVSDLISRIFSRNNVINLSLRVFTDEPEEKTKNLWQELDTVSNNSLTSLIQNKAINSADSSGDTPLLVAAINGLDSVAETLLNQTETEIEVNKVNDTNINPLAAASQNGHYTIVKELLKNPNIDVNKATISGITALHIAITNGHLDIVKELLKNPNIDVNLLTKNQSPLFIAVHMGYTEIVNELINHPKIKISYPIWPCPLIFAAAANGHIGVLQILLKHVPPNEINLGGPLAVAVEKGHKAITRELLKSPSIDVNENKYNYYSSGMERKTPLIYAIHRGDYDIIEELLNNKEIDISRPDFFDNTPLKAAVVLGDLSLVKKILQFEGLNVNFDASEHKVRRNTALITAIQMGRTEITLELLKHPNINVNQRGAYLKDKNSYRTLPLHSAISHGHPEIVDELLKHKEIDLESVDELGRSPIQIAIESGNNHIISALRQKYKELGIPEIKPIIPPIESPMQPIAPVVPITPQPAPQLQAAAPSVTELSEPEPAPPQSLESAAQNEYIMAPIIDFIDISCTTIAKIAQSHCQDGDKTHYTACNVLVGTLVEATDKLKARISAGDSIDSQTVTDIFKDGVIQMGKNPKLKGEFFRSEKKHFAVLYNEAMKKVELRQEASLNYSAQNNQISSQIEPMLDTLEPINRNNYIMEPIINFIKSTCIQLEENKASPALKNGFQNCLDELNKTISEGDEILDPTATYSKLNALVNSAKTPKNPSILFSKPTLDVSKEYNKAMEEVQNRSMNFSVEKNLKMN